MGKDKVIIPPQWSRKWKIIIEAVYNDKETNEERDEKMKAVLKSVYKNPDLMV